MDRPLHHWLPRQGAPISKTDRCIQNTVKVVAFLPVYTAIIVTLVLLVEVFGIPFVGGDR
jgi:hypothetical protein